MRPDSGDARLRDRRAPGDNQEANIAKHVPIIEQAAKEGVQIVCMQEIFTGPYFCAEQTTGWYDSTEQIPDGPTTKLMQELAKRHNMVIVVPIYEEESSGDLLQHRRRHRRRRDLPREVPEESHPARRARLLGEVLLQARQPRLSGVRHAYAEVGVYICYDRHFPEGARELGLNGAEIVFNPSATVAGLSEYLWKLEQPAHAVANAYFVGAINRVGHEQPWDIGEFYGQSYFCDPRGQFLARLARQDELITAELDLDKIREVRNTWQFYRDRRPETYGELTEL